MNKRKSQMVFRANLLYGVSALVGFLLAAFVYMGMAAVKQNTTFLIDSQLRALMLSRDIAMQLSEQERILYEYYTTSEDQLYQVTFKKQLLQLNQQLSRLKLLGLDEQIYQELSVELSAIERLSEQFAMNMVSPRTDWDLAREQLKGISDQRRLMLPQLQTLVERVQAGVNQGYQETLFELDRTTWTVVVFCIVLFATSVIVGRYIGRYIKLSITNERLAILAQRNPNPVISLDGNGELRYQNPASLLLLQKLNLSAQSNELLGDDLAEHLIKTQRSNPPIHTYEHQIGETFLSSEVHWLADVEAFDIHIQDITEQRAAEQLLIYRAFHNDLSGLENNQKFTEDANQLLAEQETFSLILAELNQYAHFSGIYGLNGVNEITHLVAKNLDTSCELWQQRNRLGCQLYQIADATFVILLPCSNGSSCLRELLRLLNQGFAQPLVTSMGLMPINLHYGVTEAPRCSQTIEELLLHGKIAMDAGAVTQSDFVAFFDQQRGQEHKRRSMLNARLEKAIASEELALYFQPQMDIASGKLAGAETLIRWYLDGSFVSPAEFIPLAEQSGFILPLGDWILEQSCKKAAKWAANGLIEQAIAVNISPRQFMQTGFVDRVGQLLAQYQLKPHLLELEITEGMVMDNEAAGLKVLQQLKQLGVLLAIDDFGTGYSSLAYLKQFPVDKLKVDQSFIRYMHQDTADQAIVLSLCQLAKNLGLEVIAEGVEEAAQLELLATYQCDVIQGYFYSKPLAELDFVAFLTDLVEH